MTAKEIYRCDLCRQDCDAGRVYVVDIEDVSQDSHFCDDCVERARKLAWVFGVNTELDKTSIGHDFAGILRASNLWLRVGHKLYWACVGALEDGQEYKLSEDIKRQLQEAIGGAKQYI